MKLYTNLIVQLIIIFIASSANALSGIWQNEEEGFGAKFRKTPEKASISIGEFKGYAYQFAQNNEDGAALYSITVTPISIKLKDKETKSFLLNSHQSYLSSLGANSNNPKITWSTFHDDRVMLIYRVYYSVGSRHFTGMGFWIKDKSRIIRVSVSMLEGSSKKFQRRARKFLPSFFLIDPYYKLPSYEVRNGKNFEILIENNQEAKDYMNDYSDPDFFRETIKGRKVWGKAMVQDGDTLLISGETINIYGIDAPEIPQTCKGDSGLSYDAGANSIERLKAKTGPSKAVICYIMDEKNKLATCFIWGFFGPMNIGQWMVREGSAWAWPQKDSPYIRAEGWAEGSVEGNKDSSIKGIWHYDCKTPWVWRKENNIK